jgi:hypothetical protein
MSYKRLPLDSIILFVWLQEACGQVLPDGDICGSYGNAYCRRGNDLLEKWNNHTFTVKRILCTTSVTRHETSQQLSLTLVGK